MSLSYDDLQAIRTVVEETISPVRGDIKALSNDIKEIYQMLADIQKEVDITTPFKQTKLEDKILHLHAELVDAAKQANITLPAH